MKTILAATLFVSSALAQPGTISLTPLKATFVRSVLEAQPDGSTSTRSTTGTYYRDSNGRTRLELGNTVVISDPIARTTITLDLAAATTRVMGPPTSAPAGSVAPASGSAPPAPVHTSHAVGTAEPVRALGTMNINGFQARGFRGEVVFPAGIGGNPVPTRHVSETWRSDDLRLHISTTSTTSAVKSGGDVLIRQSVEQYRDIMRGAQVDPSLFAIPAGFNVTSPGTAANAP
jgi:hypothetical protein